MAQILTLLQVRGSPQFAWHPLGYLWVDGELFRAVRLEPPATEGYQGVLSVKRSALRDGDHTIDGGWRHREGCRCDLCANATATPPSAASTRSNAAARASGPPPRRRRATHVAGTSNRRSAQTSSRTPPTARCGRRACQRSMLSSGTVE